MSKCQCRLRQRLGLFARQNNLLSSSTGNTLSLYENIIQQQTMLLANIEDYNSHNTARLDVEGVKGLLSKLTIVRKELFGETAEEEYTV